MEVRIRKHKPLKSIWGHPIEDFNSQEKLYESIRKYEGMDFETYIYKVPVGHSDFPLKRYQLFIMKRENKIEVKEIKSKPKIVVYAQTHERFKPIGARLKSFMQYNRIGISKMADLIGTSGTQIHNIISGKKYGIDKLLNISSAFPNLNLIWLMKGEGPMFTDANQIYSLEEIESIITENKKYVNQNLMLQAQIETLVSKLKYQEATLTAQMETIKIMSEAMKIKKSN